MNSNGGHGGDIYGHPDVRLDFSVNTNPLGMPDAVREALVSRVGEFSRYPDPECRELRAAIARHEGVPDDWVLCGNGAADLIYRLCQALKPRRSLVLAPTFSDYARALGQAGCEVARHVLSADNQFMLTADILPMISAANTDIVFLCNPNNPTGRLIPGELLGRVVRAARENGVILCVDECFLDFTDCGVSAKRWLGGAETSDGAPESGGVPDVAVSDTGLSDCGVSDVAVSDTGVSDGCMSDCGRAGGLVVLKAFTKTYAMAGLRLGYLLTSDRTLRNMAAAAAQSWSVSVPAQIAGVAALTCEDWPERARRLVAEERLFLSENLSRPGLTVFPGDANFLLLQSARPLYEPLLREGILIRGCANFEGLGDTYYRVGVKTRAENIRLVRAVGEVYKG